MQKYNTLIKYGKLGFLDKNLKIKMIKKQRLLLIININ